MDLARRLGKDPIRVRTRPGFATSRLGVLVGLEAIRMLESGVASAKDIDKAMTLGYGFPMGPLELSDLVGLDVRLSIADHLGPRARTAVRSAGSPAGEGEEGRARQEDRQGLPRLEADGLSEGEAHGGFPMVETTWTEEQATGPKKRSIPTWLWFCGGGCLLAVLLGVVAIGIGFRMLNEARDVEKQWPRLTQILPCDDPRPPPEMQFVIGTHVAGDQYQFLDSRGFQVQFQNHMGTDGTKARKDMFAADNPKFPQNLVVMKFEDIQPGTVEVQGRTLRLLRMRMELPKALNKMIPEEGRQDSAAWRSWT
jgi:hypothetical protein